VKNFAETIQGHSTRISWAEKPVLAQRRTAQQHVKLDGGRQYDCCHTARGKGWERDGGGVKDNKINSENMYHEQKKILYCAIKAQGMQLIDMPMRILVYYGNSDVADVFAFAPRRMNTAHRLVKLGQMSAGNRNNESEERSIK